MSCIRSVMCAIAATSLLYAAPTPAGADSKDLIDYREHVMNTLNEQSAAIGMILSTAAPDDNVQAHLDAIALAAQVALQAFEAKAPGGQAKPEVWANWADFSKRMNEFARKTAALAKVGREQGKDAALGNVIDALTCKSCHEIYRNDTKK